MADHATPKLVTDCVVIDGDGRILLARRKNPPFEGRFGLPGGFVDIGETLEDACRRELREETSVEARDLMLVGVYSDPNRDPRSHIVSVAYLTFVRAGTEAKAGSDAAEVRWTADWQSFDLAFDHARILTDAMALAATKS